MIRTKARRWLALAAALSLLTVASAIGAPSAQAVDNPGTLTLTVVDGLLQIGDNEFELGGDPGDPITLTGEIFGDSTFVIPAANVNFPETTTEAAPGIDANILITANEDVTGFINPATGNAGAILDLNVLVTIPILLNSQCQADVRLVVTTDVTGGVQYDVVAGTVSVADDEFSVPEFEPIPPTPAANCALVNGALGVPSESGENYALLNLVTDPLLEGGGEDPPFERPPPIPVEETPPGEEPPGEEPPGEEPPGEEPPGEDPRPGVPPGAAQPVTAAPTFTG